jgi:hypothetical protein
VAQAPLPPAAFGARARSLLFVLTNMLDALSHGAVLNRLPSLSLADATEEALRAVLAYVDA